MPDPYWGRMLLTVARADLLFFMAMAVQVRRMVDGYFLRRELLYSFVVTVAGTVLQYVLSPLPASDGSTPQYSYLVIEVLVLCLMCLSGVWPVVRSYVR